MKVFKQIISLFGFSLLFNSSALSLMKLYGIDAGSIKKSLELLVISNKRKNLTERKKTELKNRFNEAYLFLEELGFMQGLMKLKELELNFFSN